MEKGKTLMVKIAPVGLLLGCLFSCGPTAFKGTNTPIPTPIPTPVVEIVPLPQITGANVVALPLPDVTTVPDTKPLPVRPKDGAIQTQPGTVIGGAATPSITSTGNVFKRVTQFKNADGDAVYSIRAGVECSSSKPASCDKLDFPGHGYATSEDGFGVYVPPDGQPAPSKSDPWTSIAICHRSLVRSQSDIVSIPSPDDLTGFAATNGCSPAEVEVFYVFPAATQGTVAIFKWVRSPSSSSQGVLFSKSNSGVPGGYTLSSATPVFYALP